MKIKVVCCLLLTQREKKILEEALNLCNDIECESDGSEDWYDHVRDASAAIADLLDKTKDEEEN